jgi:peptidoglycan L-alanyl-D-glutamate endopeptidase CwlK
LDVVALVNGKPIWNKKDPIWQKIGEIGKSCGLEWAGDWEDFKEFPHFQYTGGLTLAQLQAGTKIA